MNAEQRLQAIHDLASARLRNGPLDPNVEHDLNEITKLALVPKTVFCRNCPHAGFLHPTPYCDKFEPLEES